MIRHIWRPILIFGESWRHSAWKPLQFLAVSQLTIIFLYVTFAIAVYNDYGCISEIKVVYQIGER